MFEYNVFNLLFSEADSQSDFRLLHGPDIPVYDESRGGP